MQGESCLATYIWIGSDGGDLRSLARVLDGTPTTVSEVPMASADGSQTGQGTGALSSLFLQPKLLYRNPFYEGISAVLVLCETLAPSLAPRAEGQLADVPHMLPHVTNNRAPCERVMREAAGSQPTFVVSQEYTLIAAATDLPLGAMILLSFWINLRETVQTPATSASCASLGLLTQTCKLSLGCTR